MSTIMIFAQSIVLHRQQDRHHHHPTSCVFYCISQIWIKSLILWLFYLYSYMSIEYCDLFALLHVRMRICVYARLCLIWYSKEREKTHIEIYSSKNIAHTHTFKTGYINFILSTFFSHFRADRFYDYLACAFCVVCVCFGYRIYFKFIWYELKL